MSSSDSSDCSIINKAYSSEKSPKDFYTDTACLTTLVGNKDIGDIKVEIETAGSYKHGEWERGPGTHNGLGIRLSSLSGAPMDEETVKPITEAIADGIRKSFEDSVKSGDYAFYDRGLTHHEHFADKPGRFDDLTHTQWEYSEHQMNVPPARHNVLLGNIRESVERLADAARSSQPSAQESLDAAHNRIMDVIKTGIPTDDISEIVRKTLERVKYNQPIEGLGIHTSRENSTVPEMAGAQR